MAMWDAGVAGWGFTHYATVPTLGLALNNPQMPTITGAGPGNQSRSRLWMAGTQLRHWHCFSVSATAGTWGQELEFGNQIQVLQCGTWTS